MRTVKLEERKSLAQTCYTHALLRPMFKLLPAECLIRRFIFLVVTDGIFSKSFIYLFRPCLFMSFSQPVTMEINSLVGWVLNSEFLHRGRVVFEDLTTSAAAQRRRKLRPEDVARG